MVKFVRDGLRAAPFILLAVPAVIAFLCLPWREEEVESELIDQRDFEEIDPPLQELKPLAELVS